MDGYHPVLGKFTVLESRPHLNRWGVETGKIERVTDIKNGDGGAFVFTDDYDAVLNVKSPIQ